MRVFSSVCFAVFSCSASIHAAELTIAHPLARTAYQTNERIDISVIRSSKEALAAGTLILSFEGEDGSKLSFTFPTKKTDGGIAVEHLHVNGRLLRLGKYQVEAASDGATAKTAIEVYSHIRRSSFRLIHWKQGGGKGLLAQGEDNLGYNLYYGQGPPGENSDLIRAGVDFMSNCTMSGGHQMDLRNDCDWSDPYVVRGGTRRVVRRAFMDRTQPNVPGVHFYDEPGLTWMKHPKTGEFSPQGIPSQLASYEAAFGHPLKDYFAIDPKNPHDVALWKQWARWKLAFMDAAWKDAQFGVSYVRPDFLSVTQSQYGWSAFTDGYYYSVVRSLPVISGHGGYHDFGPGYFNPSYFLEFARARDLARPNWYLPTWYGNTTDDQFRLEQYLSFQANIQGMMSPPDLEVGQPETCKAAAGIVESNHLMGRLGTIFTTMPVTRPPVAVLYSLSAMIKRQTEDRTFSYAHASPHGRNLMFAYLAGKLLQQPFMPIVDEDIVDGTLAAEHKAVILTSLEYLDPKVVAGLEDFIKHGGVVLLTDDCQVRIQGGVNLGVTPAYPDAARIAELEKAKNYKDMAPLTTLRKALAGSRQLAESLRLQLHKAGIKPVFSCDAPGICATRQAAGDIEYIFAVNATHDEKGPDGMLGMSATDATIGLQGDGRPIYDAIHGGPAAEFPPAPGGTHILGKFRFGPGQMRVFARTTRPIGGIKTSTPVLRRDYTSPEAPLTLELAAAFLDTKGGLLTGSAPLRIRLIDPLGAVRYDLHRATNGGTINLHLPLAVNDPPGNWKVEVTELLNNTRDTAEIQYKAVPTCPAAAGASRRAVHVAQDRDHVFRFFRVHNRATIVTGAAPYHKEAAARLEKILKPWNVQCSVVSAADVNKPRSLSEQEALTWVGLDFAGKGQIKPGDKNSPALVGFAVTGPVILLGTPEDNPLIKFLNDQHFLPYAPGKDLPGPERGLIAWQRDGIGVLQESITLIAYDEKGMSEAVGTLYEMAAGLDPLTPLSLPLRSVIIPAQTALRTPAPAIAWSVNLPDKIVGITRNGAGVEVLTHADVLAKVADGKVKTCSLVSPGSYAATAAKMQTQSPPTALAAARKQAPARRLVKYAVKEANRTAVAYWGGTLAIMDERGTVLAERSFPQDITALCWLDSQLIVGDADGRVMALNLK